MPKIILLAFLCFIFTSTLNAETENPPADTEKNAPRKKAYPKVKKMSYQNALIVFEKINEGMTQQEVRALLGAPDQTSREDPDQTWYQELWTYDFRKLAGYPNKENLTAVWEVHIMFMNQKVIHTRKIRWLEQIK